MTVTGARYREAMRRRAIRILTCPACGRDIEVVDGIWTQHTDPASWPKGETLRQCVNAGLRAPNPHTEKTNG